MTILNEDLPLLLCCFRLSPCQVLGIIGRIDVSTQLMNVALMVLAFSLFDLVIYQGHKGQVLCVLAAHWKPEAWKNPKPASGPARGRLSGV